jgi:hypothetical protein
VRAAHAEKLRQKRLLRDLERGARAAHRVMDVGGEALAILPDGRMAHLRLEGEDTFRVREVEDVEAAEAIAGRWYDEELAAEAVQ